MLDKNSKKRLLELAGMPLTEVTRRGFLAGLGTGAIAGAAAGTTRAQQLDVERQWFMSITTDDGVREVVGPFSSQQEAQTFTDSMEEKLELISMGNAEVDVIDGIAPKDFAEMVNAEAEDWKRYEEEYKNSDQARSAYNPTIRT